jgi:hypothetical protein
VPSAMLNGLHCYLSRLNNPKLGFSCFTDEGIKTQGLLLNNTRVGEVKYLERLRKFSCSYLILNMNFAG